MISYSSSTGTTVLKLQLLDTFQFGNLVVSTRLVTSCFVCFNAIEVFSDQGMNDHRVKRGHNTPLHSTSAGTYLHRFLLVYFNWINLLLG